MLSQDKKSPKSVGDFALSGTAQFINPLVHIGPSFEKTTKYALRIPGARRVPETGELINFD